jgi:hypothetical protein
VGEEVKIAGPLCIECGRQLPTSADEWEMLRSFFSLDVRWLPGLAQLGDDTKDCETCQWRFGALAE